MANGGRIEAHDIINHQDILDKLNSVKTGLEGLKTELQNVASGQKIELKNIISTAGMEKAATAISSLVTAMNALNAAAQQNNNAIQAVTQAQLRAALADKANAEAKLANAQASRVAAQAANANARATQAAQRAQEGAKLAADLLSGAIDNLTKLSYNQLSAAYSHMSAQLKNMSAETIQSTEDNRKLAAMTKNVRDAMNEAQKAMGNYSLNVGRYHTAFDGLGFSIQQVLREVPSATNISQFFLAISNNIPMVVDQMKLFNDEQKNIREQLGNLQQGTKEYMELQSKQMSLGKKVLSSIFNWQTALLAVLLLLRKLPEILETVSGWFKKGEVDLHLKNMRQAIGEMGRMTTDSLVESTQELVVVMDRLAMVEKGTDEWANGVKRVNELTGNNIDANTTNYERLKDITKEYIKQAEIIAKNNAITSLLEESNKQMLTRGMAKNARSNKQLLAILGIDEDSEEGKKVNKLWHKWYKQATSVEERRVELKEAQEAQYGNYYQREAAIATATERLQRAEEASKNQGKERIALDNYINALTNGAYDHKTYNYLISQMRLVEDLDEKDKSKSKKTKELTPKDVEDRYWEVHDALLAAMEDGYEKELAAEDNRWAKEQEKNVDAYEEQEIALKYNLEHKFITEEEYAEKLQQAQQDRNAISIELTKEHLKERDRINAEWVDKYEKEQTEVTSVEIIRIRQLNEANLKAANIKANTIGSEIARNNALIHNIGVLKQELQSLIELKAQPTTEEGIKAIESAIDGVNKKINQSRANMSFSKRLGKNELTLSDILSGAISGGGKKGIMTYAGFNEAEIEEMIARGEFEEDFKQYLDNMLDGLKTAKDEVVSYIDEMIDAWVELAEARADAAAEETEVAQEEYERQKSLMDAGYANAMETAWSEYQQKKQIQEQAEKDAKKAAEAQEALNTATQVSELVTAIAKIYSALAAAGPIGVAIAVATSAAMVGSFITQKSLAAQAAKYGDGHVEYVGYGGSHASGNDNPLAYDAQGRERRMERGEIFGVISRRSIAKYGKNNILDLFNSVNNGTYESDVAGAMGRQYGIAIAPAQLSSRVRLDNVEAKLEAISRNTASKTYVESDGTVVTRNGNNVVRTRVTRAS